jgi:hypothetical protein
VIIGWGFGGSVADLRVAEKGYRVGVMESVGPATDALTVYEVQEEELPFKRGRDFS